MKKLVVILSVFVTLASHAFAANPKVGDQAMFAVSVVQAGQTMNGTMVMAVTGMNANTGAFMVSQTVTLMGQTQTEVNEVQPADMVTDDTIQSMLDNCVLASGVIETITVPAGRFQVCTISGISYGKVPFGVVKMSQADEVQTMNFTLTSFARGQN